MIPVGVASGTIPGVVDYRFHVYGPTYNPDTTYYLDQIVFRPENKLETNTAYSLYLEQGAADLFGNRMKTDFDFEFVTMP